MILANKRFFASLLCLIILSGFAFADNSFSFAVFGDNHNNEIVFGDLLKKVKQDKSVVFAINCGDFVYSGTKEEYLKYLKTITGLGIKVYNVPGNHDLAAGGWKNYEKYMGPYYYSFDHGNSHFIVLNNAFKVSFGAGQFSWLKSDLANTKKEHIFVFMHRPTFDPTEIYAGYTMSGAKVVQELMQLFSKYKVDYVFAGPVHGYAREKRDGVTYIVTGGAGAPLHLPANFGGFNNYVKISVDGNKVMDRVVRLYGS